MTGARRLLTIGVLAFVWWLQAATVPTAAYAHAELVATSPADGQRLETAPAQVVMRFTEHVTLISDGIRLLNGAGDPVATAPPRADGDSVVLPLTSELPTGTYVVNWRVVSSDSHPVGGAFEFGVRADAPRAAALGAQQKSDPWVVAVMVTGRWAGFAGLALLIGGPMFLLVCWPAGRTLPRARRLIAVGWGASTVSTVVALLAQGPYAAGVGWPSLNAVMVAQTAGTRFGVLGLTRLALLVAGGVLLPALLRPAPRRAALVAAAVLVVGLAATYSAAGHDATGPLPPLTMTSDVAHILAMCVWLGGLVLLAACALRPRLAGELGSAARRFSRLAMASVAVLLVTGTVQALPRLASVAALTDTTYGRLLLIKLGFVAGLVGLGAASMYAVRRARDPAMRLRLTVPMETALVGAVLAVTAVLVMTAPGTGVANSPGPTHVVLAMPDGGAVHLGVAPATVGTNEVSITVVDAQGRARSVPEVTASATLVERGLGPFDVHLAASGVGFAGQVDLPLPGTWRFEVTARVSDVTAYALSSTIRVDGG